MLERLREHQVLGEWFVGTAEARLSIAEEIRLPPDHPWPYEFPDDDLAWAWVDWLHERRWLTRVDKELGALARRMRTRTDYKYKRIYDSQLWWTVRCLLRGVAGGVDYGGGEPLAIAADVEEAVILPNFTTDISDAQSLWPEGVLIEEYSSPLELCIAALKAHQKVLAASTANLGPAPTRLEA